MNKSLIAGILAAGFGLVQSGCSPAEKTANNAESPDHEASSSPADGGIDLIWQSGLDGFVSVLKDESPAQSLDEAWSIEDGMLHITGRGWGYLRTKEAYENYRLVVEYKWGEFTDGIRENRARDAGIFVHASSDDGAFRDSWPSSFEAQMVEGRAGDIIVIAALDRDTGKKAPYHLKEQVREIKITDKPSDFVYTPDAEVRKLPPPRLERVRIFRDPHDFDWKDEKGYRSPDQIENPAGEWNRMVIVCEGDSIKIILNEKTVNLARGVTPSKGHICIQSELSECWIRKLKLQPIKEKDDAGNPAGDSTGG